MNFVEALLIVLHAAEDHAKEHGFKNQKLVTALQKVRGPCYRQQSKSRTAKQPKPQRMPLS